MIHLNAGRKQSPSHIAARIAARFSNGTYTHSAETRAKMSVLRKGIPLHTEQWKKELSERMKANHPMRGKKHSEESRKKMSLSRKGVPRPYLRGESAPTWKGGKTAKSISLRRSVEYRNWREAVYHRDDYTCQSCGSRGGELSPDHIMPVSVYPEMIFDVLNGRTLCRCCHKQTDTFGGKFKSFEPEIRYLIANYG